MSLRCRDSDCSFFSRCRFCEDVRKSVDAEDDVFLPNSVVIVDEADDEATEEKEADVVVRFADPGFLPIVDPLNFNLPPTTILLFAATGGLELLLLLIGKTLVGNVVIVRQFKNSLQYFTLGAK